MVCSKRNAGRKSEELSMALYLDSAIASEAEVVKLWG